MIRGKLIGASLVAVLGVSSLALSSTAVAAQKPLKLTATVKVTHRAYPYKLTTSGKVTLPTSQYPVGCTGSHVVVTIRHGKAKVLSKNVKLTAVCTYKLGSVLRRPHFSRPTKLRVTVVLAKSAALKSISARPVTVTVD